MDAAENRDARLGGVSAVSGTPARKNTVGVSILSMVLRTL